MIENIKQKILQLDAGTFQNLCNSYLYKEKGYKGIMSLGSQAGTGRTTVGTPDAYFLTPDGKYVFAEYTIRGQRVFQKIKGDLKKCLDVSKTEIPHNEIAEIIYCHTSSNITPTQDKELHSLCIDAGVNLNLIGIDKLAEDIRLYHHDIARDFLQISLSTGQIQSCAEFVKTYNANKMAAPLDTEFLYREKELTDIDEAFTKTDVVILSGMAGAGKTRLALHYAQKHAEAHNEKLFCIRSNAEPLYEDLLIYMNISGNYFLMVDDANQLSGFKHVIEYTTKKADGYNVKILITVRDYAIEKVKANVREITTYETVKVDRFNDEEIKTLIESTLGIKNQDYLKQIGRIAEGNTRLAILAGKIACDTNRLDSIHDASELYADYYGAYLQDNHLLTENKLLISAAIVAFLEAIHLEHLDVLNPIFQSCKINRDDFIENIQTLHEKEIVDICNEKAVKFSEQCLSNYLLKLVFYDKKLIKLQQMIKFCFGNYRPRTIHSINTLLNVFRNEDLYQFVAQEIKKLWIELSQENTPWFFDFVKAFFRINPTATLLILKNRIKTEEYVLVDGKNIDFQTGRNNQNINSDIIEILSGFADMNDLPTALDLFFSYYLKRPDLAIEFYHAINQRMGIRKESFDYNFYTQKLLFEKMIEFSDGWKQESITLLFLEIAEEFLKMTHTPAEGGHKHSITIYNIPLTLSLGVEAYRKLIWQALAEICKIDSHRDRIWEILYSYNGSGNDLSDSVLEFDISYIKELVESQFPTFELRNMLLANRLVRVLTRKKDTHKALFSEYFKNTNFHAYLLLKGVEYSDELDWRQQEKLTQEAIEDYVSSADVSAICGLIDVSLDIDALNHHDKRKVSRGLGVVMDALTSRKDDYVGAIKYYFEKDPSRDVLYPIRCVGTLFSLLSDAEVLELIENCGGQQKNTWIYAYYHELPPELINKSHLNGLYEFLADASDKNITSSGYRNVDFLEKYSVTDEEVFAKGCEIIFAKAEYSPFIVGIYFGLLFNHNHNSPQEVVQKFQDGNLELLTNIYFFMEERKDSSDYDGQFLKAIYLAFPSMLDRYIDNLTNDNGRYLEEYGEKHQRFLEVDNFIEIYDYIFEQLLQTPQFSEMCIQYYLKSVLNTRKDAPKLLADRQDEWIKHCIQSFSSDELKMGCLFSFISDLSDDKKREYLKLFLNYNQTFEAFKKMPLIPTSYVYSGSAIPLCKSWINYLTTLLSFFAGLTWLEHRGYVEKKIINIREWIKQEEIDETLRG
ncbi:MAG: ATP-binding protein [Oscillospiraceae bacterium]|nr:ATP-binding protein [Oscillospiraceae bacterium]